VLFNSIEFLAFFTFIASAYFVLPYRLRWALLLAGSYYFYMSWRAEYGLLLLACTLLNYMCGLLIFNSESKLQKRIFLIISVAGSLGLLFMFKYAGFANETIRSLLRFFGTPYNAPYLNILLPVGISFFTFQALSYTIDVYRGQTKAERHFGIFALYISFFPQLVAGPIERSTNLLHQFYEKHKWESERVISGLKYIAWGLFKKIVIADRLAIYVDSVFNNVHQYHGFTLVLATYLFAFQIYCDFSGYSDVAVGAARVLGFRLMQNFNLPYFAVNVTDFWRRWHISLSTWLRDYLYIPLGGNRKGKLRTYINLIITMLLGGLWHGANWTFVIWGLYHGMLLAINKLTAGRRPLPYALRIIGTFHLVCAGWVMFRANSFADALFIYKNMFRGFFNVANYKLAGPCIGLVFMLLAVQFIQSRISLGMFVKRFPLALRWSLYYAVIFIMLIFGVSKGRPFIYFQF